LFGIVGNILVFEHNPEYTGQDHPVTDPIFSVVKRDGSYECDIVFVNIGEAKRALRLTGTQIGDRIFTVTAVTTAARFRRRQSSEPVRRPYPESVYRTALIRELPSMVEKEALEVVCGGATVVSEIVMLDGSVALVEFIDRPSMLLAFERLKVATLPDGSHARYPFKDGINAVGLKKLGNWLIQIIIRSRRQRRRLRLRRDCKLKRVVDHGTTEIQIVISVTLAHVPEIVVDIVPNLVPDLHPVTDIIPGRIEDNVYIITFTTAKTNYELEQQFTCYHHTNLKQVRER
jgi:hypothetical protein